MPLLLLCELQARLGDLQDRTEVAVMVERDNQEVGRNSKQPLRVRVFKQLLRFAYARQLALARGHFPHMYHRHDQ